MSFDPRLTPKSSTSTLNVVPGAKYGVFRDSSYAATASRSPPSSGAEPHASKIALTNSARDAIARAVRSSGSSTYQNGVSSQSPPSARVHAKSSTFDTPHISATDSNSARLRVRESQIRYCCQSFAVARSRFTLCATRETFGTSAATDGTKSALELETRERARATHLKSL